MSKIALTGNASGSGTFTLAAPNSDTDRTLTLPDETGTVLTSGGLVADNWRLSSDITTDTSPITVWERADTGAQVVVGGGLNLSSGYFTFPKTGVYLVTASAFFFEGTGTDTFIQFDIYYNSQRLAQLFSDLSQASGNSGASTQTLINVTDVSHQLYFAVVNINNACGLTGSSSANRTNFTVLRLGDAQ